MATLTAAVQSISAEQGHPAAAANVGNEFYVELTSPSVGKKRYAPPQQPKQPKAAATTPNTNDKPSTLPYDLSRRACAVVATTTVAWPVNVPAGCYRRRQRRTATAAAHTDAAPTPSTTLPFTHHPSHPSSSGLSLSLRLLLRLALPSPAIRGVWGRRADRERLHRRQPHQPNQRQGPAGHAQGQVLGVKRRWPRGTDGKQPE